MKLTAETITTDQIKTLRTALSLRPEFHTSGHQAHELREDFRACTRALEYALRGPPRTLEERQRLRMLRSKCADICNARMKETP